MWYSIAFFDWIVYICTDQILNKEVKDKNAKF